MCFLIRFLIDFYICYRAKAAPAFSAGAVFLVGRIAKLFRSPGNVRESIYGNGGSKEAERKLFGRVRDVYKNYDYPKKSEWKVAGDGTFKRGYRL